MEWGIFNDEGLLEGGFHTEDEAFVAAESDYSPDDGVYVAEVCPSCREAEARHCDCEDE